MYFSVYMYMVHGPCGFFGCMLGLHCYTGDSLVTVSGGCSPVVHWLLIVEASPVEEHGLWSTQASVVVAHKLNYHAARGMFPDQGSNSCPPHWQAYS